MSDPRIELVRTLSQLVNARDTAARAALVDQAHQAVDGFVREAKDVPLPDATLVRPRDAKLLADFGQRLEAFSDQDLQRFNELLPWAALTAAPNGRIVGNSWSASKRATMNDLVDARIVAFNDLLPLEGLHVLEAGCFEGIHTIACTLLGAKVTGFDGRMENIFKTMARVWAYRMACDVLLWNVEKAPPDDLPAFWDVLHHVGVLYHLSNPVEHLNLVLPRTRRGVLIDTHVAQDDGDAKERQEIDGVTYRFGRRSEAHRDVSPFAGLEDHAKWLHRDDLLDLLKRNGFQRVELFSDRAERNGRRVTIFAFR